jgi:hypothetical protein
MPRRLALGEIYFITNRINLLMLSPEYKNMTQMILWKCTVQDCQREFYETFKKIKQGSSGCLTCSVKTKSQKRGRVDIGVVKRRLEGRHIILDDDVFVNTHTLHTWGCTVEGCGKNGLRLTIIWYIGKVVARGVMVLNE